MAPQVKLKSRSSFKLLLMVQLALTCLQLANATPTSRRQEHQARALSLEAEQPDPMEPCYLANNRASESLTISESTPVGTVVGELMVNGDSSTNGNIELSIRMPSGNVGAYENSKRQPVGNLATPQQQQQQTNGYNSQLATKRMGLALGANRQQVFDNNNALTARSARDLNNLIDLMPPLSIEHGTKRLILAKKLDRENLDKYIAAGGYQTSSIGSQLAQSSSSASLTVHVKCQLKTRLKLDLPEQSTNVTSNSTASTTTTTTTTTQAAILGGKDNPIKSRISSASNSASGNTNSILIPIHLIVTDENDNWPVFINSPYIIDLNETVPVGSLLPGNEIVAIDNDQQGPLSTIEYSIVPGSLWSDSFAFLNPLDSRSLIVKDNRLLDYEAQSKLALKVMARDQGEPPNWAITSLYINLFDNDDLSPSFSEDKYFGYVNDNRPGEIIDLMPKRLLARDGDKTINAPIVYSFHKKTNHSIHFDLDADLGRLSLKKTLPDDLASRRQPFCLLLRATQVDNPQRWALTVVNMRLSRGGAPVLDTPPTLSQSVTSSSSPASQLQQLLSIGTERQQVKGSESAVFKFPQANFTIEVSESTQAGATILSLKATLHQGRDTQAGEELAATYHLLDDELGYFNLDERTGRLTLNKSLDYELQRHLSVRILATYEYYDDAIVGAHRQRAASVATPGSGNSFPKLICDITRVNINVISHNDFKPEFSHEQYNFQLSVSDLIANFDMPKSSEQMEQEEQLAMNENKLIKEKSNQDLQALLKRFGELENDETSLQDDQLGWRAMQLGQVYCSDRDFGDKVTLQLTGSKATLFHLTQDGRLYLPLVNISSYSLSGSHIGASLFGSGRRNDASSSSTWPTSTRTINNQFKQSRFLSSTRRSDNNIRAQQAELPDRNYLNYLLSEFSNLGRLRLKVIATDDGQPQVYQSTSIIVLTIISIDNFILQRAPQLPRGSPSVQPDGALQLNNQTSYDTSRVDASDARSDIGYNRSVINQVMMIPSTNGRSFVQINPDIISNLVSQPGNRRDTPSSGSHQVLKSTAAGGASPPHAELGRQLPSTNATGVDFGNQHQQQQQQQMGKFQLPSLLLVDDDGAKFVAMPAAMEVYNQQVQEAAELQQARLKSQSQFNEPIGSKSGDSEGSLWARWKSRFGFGANKDFSNNEQGSSSLQLLNFSTAIMLHLIALAIVVTLYSKLRSSFSTGDSLLWSARLARLNIFSRSNNEGRSVVSILDHQPSAAGTYGPRDGASFNGSGANGAGFAYLRQNHGSLQKNQAFMNSASSTDSDNSASSSTNYLTSQSISGAQTPVASAGLIVSALSNGCKLKSVSGDAGKSAFGGHLVHYGETGASSPTAKQPNLFGHLKLTLNKMLDSSETADRNQSSIGQVTVRALDSDSISFGSSSNSCINHGKVSSMQAALEVQEDGNCVRKNSPAMESSSKSSTFVGQRALSPSQQASGDAQNTAKTSTTTTTTTTTATNQAVVSISISATKQPSRNEPNEHSNNRSNNVATQKQTADKKMSKLAAVSSSSSVASLVSTSSSISNKINAAVDRRVANGDQTAGSDVSSLDSQTLFSGMPNYVLRNKCDSSSQLHQHRESESPQPSSLVKAPAPPPPPPPPPSLVQVGYDSLSMQPVSIQSQSSLVNIDQKLLDSKPFSSRPVVELGSPTRRPLPQNPVHVRLRQQAAVMSQQAPASSSSVDAAAASDASSSSAASSRLSGRRTKSSGAKSAAQGQLGAGSSLAQRKRALEAAAYSGGSRENVAAPPTPPPPPSSLSSMKTVSPTISVDRGYESFQSYSSSSQHQPQQKQQQQQLQQQQQQQQTATRVGTNQPANSSSRKDQTSSPIDLTQTRGADSCSSGGSSPRPKSQPGRRDLPPVPPSGPLMKGRDTQTSVTGRQMQRHANLKAAGQQTVDMALNWQQSIENSALKQQQPASVRTKKGYTDESARVKRSSQALALEAASSGQRGFYTVSGPEGKRRSSAATQADKHSAKSQTRSRLVSKRPAGSSTPQQSANAHHQHHHQQSADCETEDDDFYYCYHQSEIQLEPSEAMSHHHHHHHQVNGGVLSDYASHAYKQPAGKEIPAKTAASYKSSKGQLLNSGDALTHNRPTVALQPKKRQSHKSHGSLSSGLINAALYQQQVLSESLAGGAGSYLAYSAEQPASRVLQQQHQQQQQHYQHLGTSAGSKKITWSDQVNGRGY